MSPEMDAPPKVRLRSWESFRDAQIAEDLITLECVTRKQFEARWGVGSFKLLKKSELIKGSFRRRYASRIAYDFGPFKDA